MTILGLIFGSTEIKFIFSRKDHIMPKKGLPSYRLHKRSGQAVVTLNSKDFYLGKYKSKASRERYEEIMMNL